MAVLMPTRCPCTSTKAPPELPGLMAASVWMKFSNVLSPKSLRPKSQRLMGRRAQHCAAPARALLTLIAGGLAMAADADKLAWDFRFPSIEGGDLDLGRDFANRRHS